MRDVFGVFANLKFDICLVWITFRALENLRRPYDLMFLAEGAEDHADNEAYPMRVRFGC
jgi:hypothetical protein